MSLHKGSSGIAEVYKGSSAISHIYKGSSLIWQKIRDFKFTQIMANSGFSAKEVFVSKDGYYFVASNDGNIKVYDSSHVLQNTFSLTNAANVGGISANSFSGSWANTICGDDDYIYVGDHHAGKVLRFSYDGYNLTFSKAYSHGNLYTYGSYLYNGYLYMCNSNANNQKVFKINVETGAVTNIASLASSKNGPTDIIVDEDTGNIFVCFDGGGYSATYSSENTALIKLAPDGTELKRVNLFNNSQLDNSLNGVVTICFDSNGYIYTSQDYEKTIVNGSTHHGEIWYGGTDIYDKNLDIVLKDTDTNEPYLHGSGNIHMNFYKIQYDAHNDVIIGHDNNGNTLFGIPPYNFNS